jgi:hypothetical protein
VRPSAAMDKTMIEARTSMREKPHMKSGTPLSPLQGDRLTRILPGVKTPD